MKKRFFAWILACTFVGVLIYQNSPVAFSVDNIEVTIQPRRIDTKASYKIQMVLKKPLQIHDWIKIIWPKGTVLPQLPENKAERNAELKRIVESIYIGTSPCSACQGLPEINYKENSIRFNIHLELDPKNAGYETVYIHVTDRVGIVNPSTPGWYELKIQTTAESYSSTSIPYEIVKSQIGNPSGIPEVQVNPNGTNYRARYKVQFTTGTGGELFMNRSRIRIHFPDATAFLFSNTDIPKSSIQVNGKALGQQPMITGTTLTVIAPLYIGNSEPVIISFGIEVGILNPSAPGLYQIEVSTSEDPDYVLSNEYPIQKVKSIFFISMERNDFFVNS